MVCQNSSTVEIYWEQIDWLTQGTISKSGLARQESPLICQPFEAKTSVRMHLVKPIHDTPPCCHPSGLKYKKLAPFNINWHHNI